MNAIPLLMISGIRLVIIIVARIILIIVARISNRLLSDASFLYRSLLTIRWGFQHFQLLDCFFCLNGLWLAF